MPVTSVAPIRIWFAVVAPLDELLAPVLHRLAPACGSSCAAVSTGAHPRGLSQLPLEVAFFGKFGHLVHSSNKHVLHVQLRCDSWRSGMTFSRNTQARCKQHTALGRTYVVLISTVSPVPSVLRIVFVISSILWL